MADNDWKKRLGVVYSTNPDFAYDEGAAAEAETRRSSGSWSPSTAAAAPASR